MGVIRKIAEPIEHNWRRSPVVQHMMALDKKRADRVIKKYQEKLKNQNKKLMVK